MHTDLVSSLGIVVLAMPHNGHKAEEFTLVFVVVAPLEHAIVGHDLLKAFISNTALEFEERFHFVSSALLWKFCALNLGANLLSFMVGCCDEGSSQDD